MTLAISRSAALRATRIAISPRLAMSSLLNMRRPVSGACLRTLIKLGNSAAIDNQVMRVDEAALIAGQKQRRMSNIVRDAGAGQRRGFGQVSAQFRQFSGVVLRA